MERKSDPGEERESRHLTNTHPTSPAFTYIFSQLVTLGRHTGQVETGVGRAGGPQGEDHEAGLHVSSLAGGLENMGRRDGAGAMHAARQKAHTEAKQTTEGLFVLGGGGGRQ